MFIDSTEIKKLTTLLLESGVHFEFYKKAFAMGNHYEVCMPSISAWRRKEGMSVSINCITEGHTKGLLEFWDGNSEPIGHLTAEAAMEIIRKKVT